MRHRACNPHLSRSATLARSRSRRHPFQRLGCFQRRRSNDNDDDDDDDDDRAAPSLPVFHPRAFAVRVYSFSLFKAPHPARSWSAPRIPLASPTEYKCGFRVAGSGASERASLASRDRAAPPPSESNSRRISEEKQGTIRAPLLLPSSPRLSPPD